MKIFIEKNEKKERKLIKMNEKVRKDNLQIYLSKFTRTSHSVLRHSYKLTWKHNLHTVLASACIYSYLPTFFVESKLYTLGGISVTIICTSHKHAQTKTIIVQLKCPEKYSRID